MQMDLTAEKARGLRKLMLSSAQMLSTGSLGTKISILAEFSHFQPFSAISRSDNINFRIPRLFSAKDYQLVHTLLENRTDAEKGDSRQA